LETRLAAFLQSAAIGIAAFAAPALATIPAGVMAGFFVFMAVEWMQDCQLASRTVWLVTDAPGRARAAAAPGAARWRREASDAAVARFTLLQLAVVAAVYALTWAPYACLLFPLPIMGLVPLRHSVLGRVFGAGDLDALDGAARREGEGGEVEVGTL